MAKKLCFLSIGLLGCMLTVLVSAQQQVIASSGGEGVAADVNLQWTLGESIVYSSAVVTGVQLTQGFQQPGYEVTTLVDAPGLAFELMVFPIPSSDFLTISVGEDGMPGMTAVLLNMNGSVIKQQLLYLNQNQIDMQVLPAGLYLLNISDNSGKLLKSFKIVKP